MELSQLEYFNSVAMTGSFSLSAQQLGIPRPTLSLAITRLEQELGKQLFDRTGNKTALTADGQYLYGQIYSVFNIVQSTEQMIPLIQSGKEDVLTIGCYNCTLHICECIAAFSREHPEI
ncbi:MAG: LysR family transcriptional regulator, partial [Mogibacterium sp.]|nr:LysR family transcriptional regulator [Mogibacterium sp.]